MSKGHSLQDPYLNVLRKERIPVSIYLVNGIKLQGQVESFDQFVVLLKIGAVFSLLGTTQLSLHHIVSISEFERRNAFNKDTALSLPFQF